MKYSKNYKKRVLKNMKVVTSIVFNNFKNDSRVLKENISLQSAGYKVKVNKSFKKIKIIIENRRINKR